MRCPRSAPSVSIFEPTTTLLRVWAGVGPAKSRTPTSTHARRRSAGMNPFIVSSPLIALKGNGNTRALNASLGSASYGSSQPTGRSSLTRARQRLQRAPPVAADSITASAALLQLWLQHSCSFGLRATGALGWERRFEFLVLRQ